MEKRGQPYQAHGARDLKDSLAIVVECEKTMRRKPREILGMGVKRVVI